MEARWRVTLRRIAAISAQLHRFRALLFVLAAVSAAWFVWTVVGDSGSTRHSLLALSVLLWACIGLGAAYTLLRPPPDIGSGDGLWARLKKRATFAGYTLVVLLVVALTGVAAWVSLRAFGPSVG
jgi:hypothetical protein